MPYEHCVWEKGFGLYTLRVYGQIETSILLCYCGVKMERRKDGKTEIMNMKQEHQIFAWLN